VGRTGGWPSTRRCRRRALIRRRVFLQGTHRGRTGDGQDGGRRPFAEGAQVLAEPCLERPEGAAFQVLHEASDLPERILEGEPRVALAPLGRRRQPDVAADDPQRPRPSVARGQPARRQDRVQQGEAQRREDGRGTQVDLDALEHRDERDELARRVEVDELVDQRRGGLDRREPVAQGRACLVHTAVGHGSNLVLRVERGLAVLGPTTLIATDGAAIVPGDRSRPAIGLVGRPGELVGHEHPTAGRAPRREEVADRDLQARLPTRGRRHALERGIEVAHVRRSQDDLGEHAGERARFDRDRAALAIDRRPRDPAATTGEVGDDVTGTGVRLDPGGE
jgi:hypothetical protein